MNSERLAQAEKIVKVMARAMSTFEGEARTAAAMARELIEKYQFTKHELKFSNGFDPKFFEKAWSTCEMYWEDAQTFESTDTDRPADDFDYGSLPRPINPVTRQPFSRSEAKTLTGCMPRPQPRDTARMNGPA